MPSFKELFLAKDQSTTILPTSAFEWDIWASHYYRPQRSWGKVIFSQACVILFTGGVCMVLGVGGAWSGGCMVPGGYLVRGGAWWRPPPRDGYCSGGTHPTGMHSCCLHLQKIVAAYENINPQVCALVLSWHYKFQKHIFIMGAKMHNLYFKIIHAIKSSLTVIERFTSMMIEILKLCRIIKDFNKVGRKSTVQSTSVLQQ